MKQIFFLFFKSSVACVRRHKDRPPLRKNCKGLPGKCVETRNSCLLSMKNLNGSRHLVFWSLGTLTSLRD